MPENLDATHYREQCHKILHAAIHVLVRHLDKLVTAIGKLDQTLAEKMFNELSPEQRRTPLADWPNAPPEKIILRAMVLVSLMEESAAGKRGSQ